MKTQPRLPLLSRSLSSKKKINYGIEIALDNGGVFLIKQALSPQRIPSARVLRTDNTICVDCVGRHNKNTCIQIRKSQSESLNK